MPDLFIANGTMQVQEFHYRLPEAKNARRQVIPVGEQIRISGDLRSVDVDAIIKQHVKYGLIPADEILRGTKPAPLAYRVGRYISSEEIVLLSNRNQGILIDLGRQTRKDAAVAVGNALGRAAQESGNDFDTADVEITEVPKAGGAGTGESLVAENIQIGREDRQNEAAIKKAEKAAKKAAARANR